MHRCASPGGLLPEQVWDAAPIPERFLFPGRPSGSAMPLVWSHAEFLKLLDRPHDRAPGRTARSRCGSATAGSAPKARYTRWRNETPVGVCEPGGRCWSRIAAAFTLHFGWDGWQDVADLRPPAAALRAVGRRDRSRPLTDGRTGLNFTRRYGDGWEGRGPRGRHRRRPAAADAGPPPRGEGQRVSRRGRVRLRPATGSASARRHRPWAKQRR